ncbi:MAG: ATP-dependent helicase [Candidatus Kryptoniota bacterium]
MNKFDFLNDLNPEQLEAVKCTEGPVLVLAGAGSGKTKVLTYRVAYLVASGVPFNDILCLTFTNKAANEMRKRINSLLGELGRKFSLGQGWIGTFHSLFARILRTEAEKLGYTPGYTIYDEEDSLRTIRELLRERSLSEELFSPSAIRWKISQLKNKTILPEEFLTLARMRQEQVSAQIYSDYEKRLKKNNAMDFDDLLLKPILLFNRDRSVLEKYQNKFKYILVDEYQDTNRAQYILLKLLAESHRNICVVGDDAQSIYSWRGAELQNIFDFQTDYKGCRIFRLEQNYRSTGKILKAANSVIIHNRRKLDKELWTTNHEGEKLTLLKCDTDRDEGYRIVQKIREEILKNKLRLKDFVVLYRTNYQSRSLEEAFNRNGIPYVIVGGIAFYRRKEIKDILAYLKLIINPSDDESFLRVVNMPQRGIGDISVEHLKSFAQLNSLSLFSASGLADNIAEIQPRQRKQLLNFHDLIRKYTNLQGKLTASQLVQSLMDETGILRGLKEEGTTESLERIENIQEFISGIAEFQQENPDSTLQEFLSEVSLVTDVDRWDTRQNSVTLMTIHSAKGLEFPVVFVSGLEEGLFPHSSKEDEELEEERRLFYVAITRAKKKVYLSYAKERYRYGRPTFQSPSRFISEIKRDLIEDDDKSKFTGDNKVETLNDILERLGVSFENRSVGTQPSGKNNFQQNVGIDEGFKVGSVVEHEMFGIGRIVEISGKGENTRAVVIFGSNQRKQLLLRYAHLRLIK